jgi:hypothetical protein
LEHEVQLHLARVEVVLPLLKELEETLESGVDVPGDIAGQIGALRMELRGRMAAIAMGEARLGVDPF